MILIGVLLLVAAAVVGAVGVTTNLQTSDALATSFNIFGVHVAGPSGWLFLYGIVVGGVGMFAIGILYEDLFHRYESWRELRQTRREAEDLREQNDLLAERLDVEHAENAAGMAKVDGGGGSTSRSRRGRTWRFRRDNDRRVQS